MSPTRAPLERKSISGPPKKSEPVCLCGLESLWELALVDLPVETGGAEGGTKRDMQPWNRTAQLGGALT